MPTYQYACTNPECEHRFELVQSFTDASVTECPICEQNVRKVYGSVGVVFKGSGFYRTDSRSEGKSSDSTVAKSESKTESKADSSKKSDSSSSASASSSTAASSSSSSSGSSGSSGTSSSSTKSAASAAK
ncbi:putative regulatory protein, FmdB family [Frankineae bacterium MT45]|nr:putative regulatory protein, FmdB family [Frankineae bacterium MT45]